MRFLDIKTDYAFKKVFGSENSKDILMSFLNAVLDLEFEIIDLTIEDPYNVPKLKGMKDTHVDVKATLSDKTKVIVEMQILNHEGFESRILFNVAKNFANQLDVGDQFQLINPVIALTIVDFTMFSCDKTKSIYKLYEKENFTKYSDDIELIFIELPKFTTKLVDCKTIEDKWIYFIKNARRLDVVPKEKDKNLLKAYKVANTAGLSKEEFEIQEKREEFIAMQKGQIVKSRNEGRKEGEKIGEKKKAMDVANRMKKQGLDISLIAEITGLSEKEIATVGK